MRTLANWLLASAVTRGKLFAISEAAADWHQGIQIPKMPPDISPPTFSQSYHFLNVKNFTNDINLRPGLRLRLGSGSELGLEIGLASLFAFQ